MGKMIEIQRGEPNEITLEMRPLAVIAGRVLDQYGDPIPQSYGEHRHRH
jgi:hypothetical protein